MKNVENMITSKDLAYIEDMFNWNFIAFKKYNDYLDYVEDNEISKLIENLIKMHVNNCEELLNILESEEK